MGPFPNAQDRVSSITPKAGCQELDELHTTARLKSPLLVWRPGGGGFPFSPPARSTKDVRTSSRAVSPTARPRRVSPPFPSRIPLPVGPSRQLLPCGVWRAGPCCRRAFLLLLAVGVRSRIEASAQLSLLLCLEGGNQAREPWRGVAVVVL